jgi:hypothetical protein
MKSFLKKYGSLFLLLLFLFPLAEKEFHALEHKDDFHCTSLEKHYHNYEHHCDICNYTLIKHSSVPFSAFEFTLSNQAFSFIPYKAEQLVTKACIYSPSRAPPVA